ncbi:MAG: hypothetical protein ABEI97_04290, partial [Candidatus Nanohaloarchaea archaeon]
MELRHAAAGVAAVAIAVAAGVVAGDAVAERQESDDAVGQPGSAHIHASFVVAVNGSAKTLNRSYLERAARVHLHGTDNVLHVHAENVDLDYTLRTLDIHINQSCIRFGLEEETVCGGRTGVTVNGEAVPLDEALNRAIEQGDSIVVWTGEQRPEGLGQELPPAYR